MSTHRSPGQPLDFPSNCDGYAGASGRLHHLAFFVDTREEVLRAADLFLDADVPIEAAPSKHAVAQGMFLYVYEPGGNRVEVTTGTHFIYDPAYQPVMAYVSLTKPGVSRGPHEHADQADYFCFFGPSTFRVYLWDARKDSPTFGAKEVRDAGEDAPYALIVPPGVVHAYKNVGGKDGLVFNGANRLYGGWLKQDSVDEIRHEKDPDTPYKLD